MKNFTKILKNVKKLIAEQPEIFHFSSLTQPQLIQLVTEEPEFYNIAKDKISTDSKISLLRSGLKIDIEFSRSELTSLSINRYADLLKLNFTKYFYKEKVDNFSASSKFYLYKVNKKIRPFIELNKLSFKSAQIEDILIYDLKIFKSLNFDYSKHKFDSSFWLKLLNLDYNKYSVIFLDNLKSVRENTSLRHIFYNFPNLITELTTERITSSSMTAKQWIYLISGIRKKSEYNINEELREDLKLSVVVEGLSGKSTITTRLKQSIENVS